MNDEVLKILSEQDQCYEKPVDLKDFDIIDILAEEEVEYEFLFPEEFSRKQFSMRNRRGSVYGARTRRDLEEDLNKNLYDIHGKEGRSRSKTIELSNEDYKDVNYLKDLLHSRKPKRLTTAINQYTFTDNDDPLLQIGSKRYSDYDPPEINVAHPYIAKFSTYFDIFSSQTQESFTPDWTLESTLNHKRQFTAEVNEEEVQSSTSLEVVRSNAETKERSKVDSNVVDASYSIDPSSLSFLADNMKTYKQTGNGLPNALAVTDRYIIVGMSQSQLMVFPNKAKKTSDVSSIYNENGNTPEEEEEPFEIGGSVNSNDVGSVLSLSVDLSGTLCAVGFSGGNIDIINLEKHSTLKTISDVHVTAVVFVKFLSNNSILSVDYDGNVNISSFNKKLFGTNVNTTRIINRKQYGQIVDLSLIPFSLTMKQEEGPKNLSVDLVALTTMDQTIIMTINNNQANVIFTLKRDPFEVSNTSEKYDAKTKYVNNSISTAFYRNHDNSFLFARCDDSTIDSWIINTRLDQDNRLQYFIQHFSRYTISNLVYSCFFLSPYHLYCVLNNSEIIIIDLQINQIVRSLPFGEKKRFIFGNVNKKLQKVMRTVDEDEPTVRGMVTNNRVFTNSTCTASNAAFILCFNELITVEETNLEARYQKYCDSNDPLNALSVGVNYVNTLHRQLELASETKNDGEARLRYYGFVNRLSSSALRVVEQTDLEPLDRLGCAFDVLSSIERDDLIYTSVYSLCSKDSDITPDMFFSMLTMYLKARRIDHIAPAILPEYLDYLQQHHSRDEWYQVELDLLQLNYSSQIDEMIEIFNKYNMLFVVTSLYVNGKGDYISPIRCVHQAIESERALDYFCYYPCVVQSEKALPEGLQSLYSYFLFLLHTAVFGVSLSGTLLNSLGRISNQNDCFAFITQSSNNESHLHKLLIQFPDYILALVFYALSVRAMNASPAKSSLMDSDDEEAMHAAIELENYKAFYTILAKTITSGLVDCLSLRDLPSEIVDQMMFILFDLMSQWYVDSLSDKMLVFIFKYLESNSHLVKREKLEEIIRLYSFSDSTIDSISISLLSLHCIPECVKLFEKEQRYDKVLQLYFSEIRQETDPDEIHGIAMNIEQFLAHVVMKEREKVDYNPQSLKRMFGHYFVPLVYLNSSLFSYYLLVITGGSHSDVIQLLQADEHALFCYLQEFLTPSTIPALHLPSSLLKNLIKETKTAFTDDDLVHFASLLLQKQKSLLLTFVENTTFSQSTASTILELACQHSIQSSTEIDDVCAMCLLYHLTGKTDEALETVSNTLRNSSELLKQALRSLFNIKDLEKPFLYLQNASQIVTIFSRIFPVITSDLDYESLQNTSLHAYWQQLLADATDIISQVRKVLTLKTDMSGNRKIIAGLELLERTASGLLQQMLDSLQVKIPLAVLLTCVLNQNTGNTVHDISGIVSKVIRSLQMDIEGYDKFVRIYRRDYNECLHQKAEIIKQPFLFQFSTCAACKQPFQEGEDCRAFNCGHIYHVRCCEASCSLCEKLQNTNVKRNEKYTYLPISKKDCHEEETVTATPLERWQHYRQARNEQNNGTMFSIYNTMYGNKHAFTTMLEVPSIFSPIVELPDTNPDMLVSAPQAGSLPIKPYMKGECVLLPNP